MDSFFLANRNSSETPLAAGATFTGGGMEVNDKPDVMVSCIADVPGTMQIQFSIDGRNWDSTVRRSVAGGTHEFSILRKGGRYCRVVYTNGSTPQTYFRLGTSFGTFGTPTSGLTANIQSDADAITARTIGEESFTAEGRYVGRSIVNKFGRNSDVDTASTPEDVWNGGGVYAGFPTGAPEEFQAFSSDAADTGVLTITYLPSSTSTAYLTANITLNGTTPVNSGVVGYRMHTARYSSGTATGFNVGTITVRHRTTTANVFCVMPIGRSQTNVAAYTVPAGNTAYLRRLFCRVIGATSGTVDGAVWVRGLGESPRLRRPFTAGNQAPFEERPYGGLVIGAGSDIQIRLSTASANNLDVIAGYDIILVENV